MAAVYCAHAQYVVLCHQPELHACVPSPTLPAVRPQTRDPSVRFAGGRESSNVLSTLPVNRPLLAVIGERSFAQSTRARRRQSRYPQTCVNSSVHLSVFVHPRTAGESKARERAARDKCCTEKRRKWAHAPVSGKKKKTRRGRTPTHDARSDSQSSRARDKDGGAPL